MYNRYIPQPDGSFRRNQIRESHKEPERDPVPMASIPPAPLPECPANPGNCLHCSERTSIRPPSAHKTKPPVQNISALRFLRQLLPKNFDAEDLLVVLLLLLMTGDNREDQNSSLLTLLLYLFL